MDYDHARQQAMAYLDAFNRLDLDAAVAGLHEEFTHQSPFADRRLGQHESRLDGKQVYNAPPPGHNAPQPKLIIKSRNAVPALLLRAGPNRPCRPVAVALTQ